ncbi:choice-of-anchor R domain-containing protein [Candidatus Poriferisodalis sp.]|uniref:choice-of-anchor R domain-containing protein n=1 Tax=Candidatus Poriferisodalis sp. TaxID=3101277 RepID=UPI003B028ECD
MGVTFSEAVVVTGTPQVTLDIGGTERAADYIEGSGTVRLLFGYTVVAEDRDGDGIALVADSLTLNGGTIKAADDSADADLAHAAVDFPGHKVNPIVAANVEDSLHNIDEAVSEYTTGYVAQQFTTSINPGGFSLAGVRLRLGDFTDGEISVTVRADDDGAPGDVLVVLTNPDPLAPNSINVFTDPDQAQLAQQTRYWIVVNEGIAADSLIPVAGTTSSSFFSRAAGAIEGLPAEEQAGALVWGITAHSSRRASESDDYEQSATLLMFGLRTRVNANETGFTCHIGSSHVNTTNAVFLSIVGHDSQPRVEEGDDITVSVRSDHHGVDSCQGEPEAPWRFRLTVTHTVSNYTADRVAEEHVTTHEGFIHRDARTFTLTIPTINNATAERDSYVDVELSVPAEHNFALPGQPGRLLAIGNSKRFVLFDDDQYSYSFTQPCDQDFIDVDEGDTVDLQIRRTPPPAYPESILLLTVTGTASRRDFTVTDGTVAVSFAAGGEFGTVSVDTTQDGTLENPELFQAQLFINGLDDRATLPSCPAGRFVVQVRILDDDDMTINMGPQTRTVAAGQTIRFAPEFARTAYVARPFTCDVPFPFFLDFEVSDEDGVVVDHSAATTGRTTFCTNDIRSFTLQTVRPPCSSPGTRQVRLTPRLRTTSSEFAEVFQNSMFMEHDEYVVVVEDDVARSAWAEGFRTGSHAQGYRIVGVEVETLAGGLPGSMRRVDVYPANDAGEPELWRQWPLRAAGGNRFVADEPMRLEPDTGYLLVVHAHDALGMRSAANDRADVASVADQSGFSFSRQYTQLRRCSPTHRSFGEWTPDDGDLIWMSLELTELDAPAATAAEPADAEVDWKTSLSVGQWVVRHRERERGWRVDWCWQTRADTADIEDHYDGDLCYGSIADKDFEAGGATFELEGVWHMVSYGSHDVVIEFNQQQDITPLLDRTFVLNGREFAVADRIAPRGSDTTSDRIVWQAEDWNSITGWPVDATVWVALQAQNTAPQTAAEPNSAATGAPAITGTALPGETLTATTTGISDENGLQNAAFAYQWIRHDLATQADDDIDGATGPTYLVTAADEGKALKVTVSFTDDAGNDESLTSHAVIAAAPVAPRGGPGANHKQTVDRPPLTATAGDVPESHDGRSVLTFSLTFSDAPHDGFSYKTLRDHALTVTGGEVTRAKRDNAPNNTHWRISVRPHSDATVTIILPATTDCNAQDAICTDDGSNLSTRLEITVQGPHQ